MLYIILGIVCLIGYIALKIANAQHIKPMKVRINAAIDQGVVEKEHKEEEIAALLKRDPFVVPGFAITTVFWIMIGLFIAGSVNGMFFMQEPRFNTFVRDITGTTHTNFKTGWHIRGFGTVTEVKKEMSAAFGNPRAGQSVSFQMPPKEAVFLDNVSAKISTTVRIVMPTNEKDFRNLIEKFGTAENAMASLMIPSIERTIDATTGLMTAEKYFSGGKTEFMNEFDTQMRHGLYVVDLIQTKTANVKQRKASQNASLGTNQDTYGDTDKIVYTVIKRMDENNRPVITPQEYAKYGISIASAIVTELDPNNAFDKRMELKQKASADLAIAKEDTKKEEAQKLLAIARGEREAAESQAAELKIQVTKTTEAETTKQLALTLANQQKESMAIQEETALLTLKRDRLTAKSIIALADATAYEKKATIKANGALELKLAAWIEVMKHNADAIKNRKVPTTLINMGGTGGSSGGNDLAGASSDINNFMQLMGAKAAKDLALDMSMTAGAKTVQ